MFTDYYEIREWLESFIPQVWTKKELGLARIRYLLKLLDNPQDKFKSIHVAGTSGKGSVAFYIARLLQCIGGSMSQSASESVDQWVSGSVGQKIGDSETPIHRNTDSQKHRFTETPKIGLHLSPHLVDIRERMQIFQRPVTRDQRSETSLMLMGRFLELFNEMRPVVEKIRRKRRDLTPSYFEILVAASFLYFAKEKVEWAVVEVGLGGRLDATNVLKPKLSIITNVGFDHTDILGKTIKAIAFEKAGIIKAKVPVVTGCPSASSGSSTSGKALKVIEKVAKEKKAPLIKIEFPNQGFVNPVLLRKIDTYSLGKVLKSDTFRYITNPIDIQRHILNSFAYSNKLLALSAVNALGIKLTSTQISKAFDVQFPGRFEEIGDPTSPRLRGAGGLVLDGAHNPDKIRFLIDFVRKFQIPNSKLQILLVVAFKRGKEWKKMIDLLVSQLPVKKVITTQFYAVTDTGPPPHKATEGQGPAPTGAGVGKHAAVEPREIATYVKSKWKVPPKGRAGAVESYENSQEAVFEVVNRVRESESQRVRDLILVTGSLYLVGEVRTMWHLPSFAKASPGEPEF